MATGYHGSMFLEIVFQVKKHHSFIIISLKVTCGLNAKLGSDTTSHGHVLGKYDLGVRNNRGKR